MRRDVDEVAGSLAHYGFTALALHGDMEQRDRDEVLVRFANRSCSVLVASDVAARGLDVKELAMVVNYDLPSDADIYVHRIGRTGRAGSRRPGAEPVQRRAKPARASAIEERQGAPLQWFKATPLSGKANNVPPAAMTTLRIDAGRSDKLRPGDILGALTGEAGLKADAVGKIDVFADALLRRGRARRRRRRRWRGCARGRSRDGSSGSAGCSASG